MSFQRHEDNLFKELIQKVPHLYEYTLGWGSSHLINRESVHVYTKA